jgi:uncharacterized iron-regulated membrane protein
MFHLHVDLYAGRWGKLFLGLMGLLLVASISGVALYGPFMRKLDFGDVRRERGRRLKWLDRHNLLGIVTLVWALVVGAGGGRHRDDQHLGRPAAQILASDRNGRDDRAVQGTTGAGFSRFDAKVAGQRGGGGARHENRLCRLPGHAVQQHPSLRRLHARHRGAHRAPVQAGC